MILSFWVFATEMNIVCLICSELLKNENVVATNCGHVFHRECLESWINSSRTCPTCRSFASSSSLIKLYFESSSLDDQKASLQLNDILQTNDELSQAIKDMKEKTTKLELELCETQMKLRESSANEKRLERQKQLDDMTIAGIKGIKNESTKEILKLNQSLNNLKLDLLAEKQLRRMHQTSLHELKPDDENYNVRSIKANESANGVTSFDVSVFAASSSGMFNEPLQIIDFSKKPATSDQPQKDTKPYVIPSKIQKALNKEPTVKNGRFSSFKTQKSLWDKSDNKPVGFPFLPPPTNSQPSTSSAAILNKNQKRAFGEGLVFAAPLSTAASTSTTAPGSSFFNFTIDPLPFPIATATATSSTSNIVTPSALRNYREVHETSPTQSGPKISDR